MDNNEAQLNQVAPGGTVQIDWSKVGGESDEAFESLFSGESTQPTTARATETPATQQTAATTPTPTATTPVEIKAAKSVYKSVDAAIEGINQKDALIETLRTRYALTTGIDPITGQPVAAQQSTQQSARYQDNPTKYLEDLYGAANKGPTAYAEVQGKFVDDKVDARLEPLAPLIQDLVEQKAIQTASKDNPDIAKFVNSQAYERTLDANEDLKLAISNSKADARFHSRLPHLLKLTYLAGQGMQLPDLLKAQASTPSTQTQTQTQVRTTMQPTTPSPAKTTVAPNFRTHEGIKSIVADMEARGFKLDL